MHKKILYVLLGSAALLVPQASFAQGNLSNIRDLATSILDIIRTLLVVVFVLALIVFSWGIVKYLTAAGDAAKLKAARPFLWWGMLGIFVLAAMMGLVAFIRNALGLEEGALRLRPPAVIQTNP